MTNVVDWRGGAGRKHEHVPLPEPPRYHHIAKSVRVADDAESAVLEEWLRDLVIARTVDAD